jgi:hypothetical protein
LFWIRGDPGKGKTMLLCGVIDELTKQNADTKLVTFFCQATDARLNNATAVLRGLICLFVNQMKSLIRHIQEKYDHVGKQLFEDVNAWVALSEILSDILQDASLQNTYFIVDALDECETYLPQLLELIIQESFASSRVKWIVSSRNWPQTEEIFARTTQVQLSLELSAEFISAAIGMYTAHKVDKLAQMKRYDDSAKEVVRNHQFNSLIFYLRSFFTGLRL